MPIFSWLGRSREDAGWSVDFNIDAPAMSPKAAARGLSWDMGDPDSSKMVRLMHEGQDIAQIMCGAHDPVRRDIVMPPVVEYAFIEAHPLDTPDVLRGEYDTLPKAMKAAERWAVDGGIEQRQQFERDNPDRLTFDQERQVYALNDPLAFFQKPEVEQLAEASASFHAELSRMAESRDAGLESGRDFGLER